MGFPQVNNYKKLPYDIWLKTFELVPRVAFDLVIVNEKNEVLLTKRAIPPCVGIWHIPGSFLRKNELITKCLKRIAIDELGIEIEPSKTKLMDVTENITQDPRGHAIDVLYKYKVGKVLLKPNKFSKELKFFSKLPDGVGFNHREILEKFGWKSRD